MSAASDQESAVLQDHTTAPMDQNKSVSQDQSENQDTEDMPASVPHQVDFIMNVALDSKDGTNIPLFHRRLKAHDGGGSGCHDWTMTLSTVWGDEEDVFNAEREDYWLFYVHLNHARMAIAIGGEDAVMVTSGANFDGLDAVSEDPKNDSIEILNSKGKKFRVFYNWLSNWDRLIAVRCAKMDNPAITVTVDGYFGGLRWVGLFVKNATDSTNNFIAVRTNNHLNPRYAALTKNHPVHKAWYQPDRPVCLSEPGVSMTIFPKQLFGTNSNSSKLYDKFVTQDPYNATSNAHLVVASRLGRGEKDISSSGPDPPSEALPPPVTRTYVWAAKSATWIKIRGPSHEHSGAPGVVGPGSKDDRQHDEGVNYVSGIKLDTKPHDHGWNLLLTLLGGVTQVLTGILSGSLAGIVGGVLSMGDVFDEKKMHAEADVNGFITGIAKGVDAYNKMVDDGKKKNKKTPQNVNNVLQLNQLIVNNNHKPSDFGMLPNRD